MTPFIILYKSSLYTLESQLKTTQFLPSRFAKLFTDSVLPVPAIPIEFVDLFNAILLTNVENYFSVNGVNINLDIRP